VTHSSPPQSRPRTGPTWNPAPPGTTTAAPASKEDEGARWREPEEVVAASAEGEQWSAVAREGRGRDASGEDRSARGRRWIWEEAREGSWTAAARRRPEGEVAEVGSQRTRSTEKGCGWRRKEGLFAIAEVRSSKGLGLVEIIRVQEISERLRSRLGTPIPRGNSGPIPRIALALKPIKR
jgi:hypothetical protein